jgi:hypothetical protein
MGQLASGQQITTWWEARNHADPNHRHKTVQFYISGPNPTRDLSKSEFQAGTKFCELPFDSGCEGGTGQRPCSGTCTLPEGLVAGATYTVWWYWPWKFPGEPTNHGGLETYANCADFRATTGGQATPTAAPTPAPGGGATPPTAGLVPGCYHWTPTGCQGIDGSPYWTSGFQFIRDEWGEANENAAASESICLGRKASIDSYCQRTDVVMHYAGAVVQQPLTYAWGTSNYGACSAPCGGGTMTRTVTCYDNMNRQVANNLCTATMPPATTSCNTQDCPTTTPGGPTTTPGGTYQYTVKLTVEVAIPVSNFDTQQFLADLASILGIPPGAIENVQVDLDRSDENKTVLTFVLKTVQTPGGGYTDPLRAAQELRAYATDPARAETLESYAMMYGLVIEGETDPTDGPTGALSPAAPIAAPAAALLLLGAAFFA